MVVQEIFMNPTAELADVVLPGTTFLEFSKFAALSKSRVAPPLLPIGNKVCTAGFICLGAAFSGLPILTPIEVENLFLILIPDD